MIPPRKMGGTFVYLGLHNQKTENWPGYVINNLSEGFDYDLDCPTSF